MRRRELIFALPASIATYSAFAQQGQNSKRVGVLYAGRSDDASGLARITAFKNALSQKGWIDGQNIDFVFEWGAVVPDLAESGMNSLASKRPDAILANGTIAAQAAKKSVHQIPTVFVSASDPVGSGLVSSLGRPGGNVTGFTNLELSIAVKWVELLMEVAPYLKKIFIMTIPDNVGNLGLAQRAKEAGVALGVQVDIAFARDRASISSFLEKIAVEKEIGVIVSSATPFVEQREAIVEAMSLNQIPAIYSDSGYCVAGGLVSYGVDVIGLYQYAAEYVDKILRGAPVGELPVQAPREYKLVVNMKAANSMRLGIPNAILARADEVIE